MARGTSETKVRVTTFDGPGADPVMREVPWPKVLPEGALTSHWIGSGAMVRWSP